MITSDCPEPKQKYIHKQNQQQKKILITNYTKDIYSSRSTSWLNSYLNILCMASNKLFSNTGKKEGKLEKSIACASVLHRHGKDV